MQKGKTFYDFQFNTRLVKSTVVHFQVEILFIATYYYYIWWDWADSFAVLLAILWILEPKLLSY